MKVLICHNCGGFGVTIGPVLRPVCVQPGEDDGNGDGERPSVSLRREAVVYPCQACDGAGFFTVAAAS
jgi:hypothetical protein